MSSADQIASANGCYDRHLSEAARYVLTPERRAYFVRLGLIQLPEPETKSRTGRDLTKEERAMIKSLIAEGWPRKTIAARFHTTPASSRHFVGV